MRVPLWLHRRGFFGARAFARPSDGSEEVDSGLPMANLVHRFISRQLRRPSGLFGRRVMTRLLDRGNAPLIQATVAAAALHSDSCYLDAGFGGGLSLRLALRSSSNTPLYGIDFSPDVVREGHRRFKTQIVRGEVALLKADVADLPFRDGMFDAVTTINTVYFWPDPAAAFRELARVTAPGGRLAIGFTGAEKMAGHPELSTGFRHVGPAQVEAWAEAAGFSSCVTQALEGRVTAGDFVTVAHR